MRGRSRFGIGGALVAGSLAAAWLACGGSDDAQGGTTSPPRDGGAIPGADGASSAPIDAGASVLQHHKHASRDGLYLEPSITKATAKTMHLDPTFRAPVKGPIYAQPLYVEPGPKGKEVLLVATEQNEVYAFDAASGAVVWKTPALGKPVSLGALQSDPGCGNVDPLGITGTPFVDLATRTVFLDAMVTPDDGATKKHQVFALSLDDGGVRAGWPIDVEAALSGGAVKFVAKAQSQRGALLMQDRVLYVGYGGHFGDCGPYRGWVVAIPIDTPGALTAWSTGASRGGVWAPSGIVSDGTSIFATTGNTAGATQWGQGEAVVRLTKGAIFSGKAPDYFAPTNWKDLDDADLDLGGQSAFLVDVPGATPSALVVALGKDANAYLLDRANLGGIGSGLAKRQVSYGIMNGAAATYRTALGTYVAFHGSGVSCNGAGALGTFRIAASAPPSIATSWCATQAGLGSPMVTTSNGTADAIVWAASDRLYGFDGDTGAVVFGGGGAGDALPGGTEHFNTPIAAKGRIFVAGQAGLYAFTP